MAWFVEKESIVVRLPRALIDEQTKTQLILAVP